MSRCPFATWIGTPDHFGYPPGMHGQLNPLVICDHVMCGTLKGCDAWFNGGGLSATFGIGKDGDIHQYVELEDIAWANGSLANPDPALAYIYENYNPNVVTWSIEHEGWPNDRWTEAMYQADLKLKRYLLERQPGLAIVGHFQFDSVNRANCPGPHWPRERLLNDLYPQEDDMDDERVREIVKELLGYQLDAKNEVVQGDMAKMRVQALSVMRIVGLALAGTDESWQEARQIMDFYGWGRA